MVQPVRMVLDISHHNTISSFDEVKRAGIVGIIHKASEGSSYVDDKYAGRRKGCAEYGIEWGAYHFATASNVAAQVDHFLRTAQPDERTLMCLDWEDYGDNTMSLDQAREFMRLVDERCGVNRCVLYSGNTAKEALGSKHDAFFAAHRLWLAQYGTNPVPQASWDDWWLWQYSDGETGPQPRGCPGVTGFVDTNSYDGSADQLRAEWCGVIAPPSPTPETVVHVIVPHGVRVVVHEDDEYAREM